MMCILCITQLLCLNYHHSWVQSCDVLLTVSVGMSVFVGVTAHNVSGLKPSKGNRIFSCIQCVLTGPVKHTAVSSISTKNVNAAVVRPHYDYDDNDNNNFH